MRTRRTSALGRLVLEFRQLRFAVDRFYRRRKRRTLTPEEEAERLIERMHRLQDFSRRYGQH